MIQTGARSNKRKIRTRVYFHFFTPSGAAQFAILRDTRKLGPEISEMPQSRMPMAPGESEVDRHLRNTAKLISID